jgi:hypothetical protein
MAYEFRTNYQSLVFWVVYCRSLFVLLLFYLYAILIVYNIQTYHLHGYTNATDNCFYFYCINVKNYGHAECRKYVKKGEIWNSSGHGPVELENVV